MADKTPFPNPDKIVLEYLNGGVTYRQLEAKYGIDHAQIHYWVQRHRGIRPDRTREYEKAKQRTNTTADILPTPAPTPQPSPTPPVDKEKVKLQQQLQQAQFKIALLEEVIRIAHDEQGLEVPKKFSTKLSRLWDKTGQWVSPCFVHCLVSPDRTGGPESFYAFFRQQTKQAFKEDLVLAEVLRIRALLPRLGTRKLLYKMKTFLEQHQFRLGRLALFGLMSEHRLLIRRRVSRKPKTTQSLHWYRKHPNLIVNLAIIQPNQVWVGDITYVMVGEGFVYLFLLTDAYSRKVVGYGLEASLHAQGAVKALRMAVGQRPADCQTIHHSDRGIQYCCWEYMAVLNKDQIRPSMTQHSDPRENAIAERINGILKSELLTQRYATLEEARQALPRLISLYNVERPHLSLDMLTPSQAHEQQGVLKRRWKAYPFKGRNPGKVQTGPVGKTTEKAETQTGSKRPL